MAVKKINLTEAKALKWLVDHDGVGAFIMSGEKVMALDTVAPFKRSVWVALRDAQRVEFREGKVRVL